MSRWVPGKSGNLHYYSALDPDTRENHEWLLFVVEERRCPPAFANAKQYEHRLAGLYLKLSDQRIFGE